MLSVQELVHQPSRRPLRGARPQLSRDVPPAVLADAKQQIGGRGSVAEPASSAVPPETAYAAGMETMTTAPLDLYAVSPGTLLTEVQVAHALQFSTKTLRNRRSNSLGPPWRSLGSAVRYRAGDLVKSSAP